VEGLDFRQPPSPPRPRTKGTSRTHLHLVYQTNLMSCAALIEDIEREESMPLRLAASLIASTLILTAVRPSIAQVPLRDPNLPSVSPQALQHLSDDRVRQDIVRESQARYRGRCVCCYQTQNSDRRSCKGWHEVIKTKPIPLCYPAQVSNAMIQDWRQRHP
jgi:hypothetical protein